MSKRKLNYVDGLIIIAVLVVALGAIWYITKDDGAAIISSNKVQVTFVAEAEPVSIEALQQLKIGDVIVAMGNYQDAKIVDISISESSIVEAINGELVMVEDGNQSRISVTITGTANKYGPYIELGGQEIKAGTKYYIKTNVFEAFGKVVEVTEIK